MNHQPQSFESCTVEHRYRDSDGFYKDSEADKVTPVVDRPDIVEERNAKHGH